MTEEQRVYSISVDSSSIEIGTPSKGGTLKLYFDPNDLEASKNKLDNAMVILRRARELTSIQ